MPGRATMTEAKRQPSLSADADFGICLIGYTSDSPLDDGKVSVLYGEPATLASDYGIGDAVDVGTQAITITDNNPGPPPIAICPTPDTNDGTYGTLSTDGVHGTSIVTTHAGSAPKGTWEIVVRVTDDGNDGDGTTVGSDGIYLQASLNGGRNWLPAVALGTDDNWKVKIGDIETGVWFDFTSSGDTLKTGDTWSVNTLPPQWDATDLYDASDPDNITGAFAAIAEHGTAFAILVITEPVADADFDTLVAGLNYGLQFGKRWSLIIRFRDPEDEETDAEYIQAFQTFVDANHDNRITCLAGSARVTEPFRGYTYQRTFLAGYLARLQSFAVIAGQEGERIAQNPGWVARGPLEGVSLLDESGHLIGHDEATRGGIEAANDAPTGRGVCLYYQRNFQIPGTYVTNRVTVMYDVDSEILSPMDRRVANGCEMLAVAISLQAIGGADVWDPATLALDEDIKGGLERKIAKAIRDRYPNEFQNALEPNLVQVNPTVTVSGDRVKITGKIKPRFYGYTDEVDLTFEASR